MVTVNQKYTLNTNELEWARLTALRVQREDSLWEKGGPTVHMTQEQRLNNDFFSFAGELAAARILNLYPSGLFSSSYKDPDMSINGVQIDAKVAIPPNKNLSIRFVKEDHIYVLMVGQPPTFHYAGWCFGRDVLSIGLVKMGVDGKPYYLLMAARLRSGMLGYQEQPIQEYSQPSFNI